MENKCQGCGEILQTENPQERGYAKAIEHQFCQSCFRLKNYRDFKHVRAEVNDSDVLDFIQSFEGTIFWIIDLLNINQSMHPGLMRSLVDKNVVLLGNKRDLYPQSLSDTKLLHALMREMNQFPLSFMEVQFVSAKKRETLQGILPYLEHGDIAFVGAVNAGKSSLLNALLGKDTLSVSPVASTTAQVMEIKVNDYTLYDTPGLQNESKLSHHLNDEDLLSLAPQKTMKPQVYQIYEKQSLVIGNIGSITIEPIDQVQVIAYVPVVTKRVKPERVDANFKQAKEMVIDNATYRKRIWPKADHNVDLEIFDIGFFNIKGKYKLLETNFDKNVEIVFRRAMI
ncbi:GTPase [Erysipelothrix urinaevulpis]|uniref:GTPase n=1 Tax=Erysipelothrix urinaevulpis TaxID=2683717 RepID=UPI00135C364B|nr:GTPase [Erysipelothrix urinaevulpis]